MKPTEQNTNPNVTNDTAQLTPGVISNRYLTVRIASLGAELQSIQDRNGIEYLWQGDPEVWEQRSPLLFPTVCGLWQGRYKIDGQEYVMPKHGFASRMHFTLRRQDRQSVTYTLSDTEETLRMYPYPFHLAVTYRLSGRKLTVKWYVENTGRTPMHFGIGGHPGFNVPGITKGQPLKGTILMDNAGAMTRLIANDRGFLRAGRFPFETEEGRWHFTESSFEEDSIILDRSQVTSMALLDQEGQPAVTVTFKAPAVGIWSPVGKQSSFVCFEPWYGMHDYADYDGEFSDKYLINHLQPGAAFTAKYTIKIGR